MKTVTCICTMIFFCITETCTVFAQQSPFVLDATLLFPIGWDEEAQAKEAIVNLEVDVPHSFMMETDRLVLTSPIAGSVRVEENYLILSNDAFKITYPIVGKCLARTESTVGKGDPILALDQYNPKSFLAFLRRGDFRYPRLHVRDDKLSMKLESTHEVFAVCPGRVDIHQIDILPWSIPIVAYVFKNDLLEVSYQGVTDLAVTLGVDIEAGSLIGVGGVDGVNNNWLVVQIHDDTTPIPNLVFIDLRDSNLDEE